MHSDQIKIIREILLSCKILIHVYKEKREKESCLKKFTNYSRVSSRFSTCKMEHNRRFLSHVSRSLFEVGHREREWKIASTILGKPKNSARSENLYGTPYRRAHGALAHCSMVPNSLAWPTPRLHPPPPPPLPPAQTSEWFHRFRNFVSAVLFRYLWRLMWPSPPATFLIFTWKRIVRGGR